MPIPAKQQEPDPDPLTATDGELLMRFVRGRDRAAMEELVEKHAPMVLAVCRQILGGRTDAEDAFQATFLILARRAGSIQRKSSVAGWLYRVAHRTAMRLAVRARRHPSEPLATDPVGEPEVFSIIHQRELHRALHEELSRLPARYREPLVLMYFAGKSREEIAEELECTDAAVKGRLARGRKTLRLALARRGVGLSVALTACVAVSTASASTTTSLTNSTVVACLALMRRGGVLSHCSPKAIQLAKEGVRTMMISSLTKTFVAPAVLGIAVIAVAQIPGPAGTDRAGIVAETSELSLVAAGESDSVATRRTGDEPAAVVVTAPGVSVFPVTGAGRPIAVTGAPAMALSEDATAPPAPAAIPAGNPGPPSAGSLSPPSVTIPGMPVASTVTSPILAHPSATPGNDPASLQMLEDYYMQRVQASEMRQEAKKVEIQAYDKSGTDREQLLDRAKQVDAQADIVELRAEAEFYQARAGQLRKQREQTQMQEQMNRPAAQGTPTAVPVRSHTEPMPHDATLSPGDRIRVRLFVSATDSSHSQNLDEVVRVEPGGTLPLGPILGRATVGGKTLLDAERFIRDVAQKTYRDAAVQLTRAEDTPHASN